MKNFQGKKLKKKTNIISIDVVIRIKVLLYQTGLHYKKKKKLKILLVLASVLLDSKT